MSAHTPGPWHQDKWGHVKALGGESVKFSSVTLSAGTPEHLANDRLIAAAPELLEAALSTMAWWKEHEYDTTGEHGEWNVFDNEPKFVTAARAAIAKATGSAP